MFLSSRAGALTEPLTGRHWSEDDVHREVLARILHFSGQGFSAGDRVFLHYGNTLEFFVDLLAAWYLGATVIPIDERLRPFEVGHLAAAAKPAFSVWKADPTDDISSAVAEHGARIVRSAAPGGSPDGHLPPGRVSLEGDALILFTSGTTGDPKGVVHTHRTLRARWTTLKQSLGLTPYERTLCLLPTHFGHGLICNCLFPWLSGMHLHILPPFRTEVVSRLGKIVEENDITFFSSVPSVWRVALKVAAPPRPGLLRRVSIGSAPLSAHLWNGIRDWTGTKDVINSYGITETGSWVAGTTLESFEPQDGLIGVGWGAEIRVMRSADPAQAPGIGEEARVGEDGAVWLNTPALMKGYLDRPDLTSAVVSQGWFQTGDVGVLDEQGVLYLRGRTKEEINRGGMKIHPGDVDAVVEAHELTKDVCTFAFDEELYGQEVAVAVVLDASDPEEAVRDIQRWTAERLAGEKLPKRWYVVDEIPRTSRGKVNRDVVSEKLSGESFLPLGRGFASGPSHG